MMYRLVSIMFTLVHHSCYAEKMFSNLNRVMDEQKSSLEDYRKRCVMLSMNEKPLAEAELMLSLLACRVPTSNMAVRRSKNYVAFYLVKYSFASLPGARRRLLTAVRAFFS